MQYASARDATNSLAEHLRDIRRRFAGALFRVAFYKRGNSLEFLTGSIGFHLEEVASRTQADYGFLLFVEQWCSGQQEAHGLVCKALEGQAEISGHKLGARFSHSRFEHHTHARDYRWSGLQVISTRDREPKSEEIYLPQEPVVGFGLPPYWGPMHAISNWIFDAKTNNPASNSVPNLNSLVITVPDTRARIVLARWTPGKLRIKTEVNTSNPVQLQLVQIGSAKPYQLLDGKCDGEILVPSDTHEILAYLVHRSGDCITQLHIGSMYRHFGQVEQKESGLDQAIMELGRGENERVEYKPFFSPNHEKEMEFVETAIAFANTLGGTIYVGVRDRDGSPYGLSEVQKLFKGERNPVASQVARLQWLLTNKVKPIPPFNIEELRPWGEPVVVASIDRGRETPYSTHENQIFIRRASTNYRPDAAELRELMVGTGLSFSAEL